MCKIVYQTGSTHFNGFLDQLEDLHDHFGESQVVTKIHPLIACFQARILRVATGFASFLILANMSFLMKCGLKR